VAEGGLEHTEWLKEAQPHVSKHTLDSAESNSAIAGEWGEGGGIRELPRQPRDCILIGRSCPKGCNNSIQMHNQETFKSQVF
jgi:hypothetical protein